MLQIPLQAIPNQVLNTIVGGQYVQINLYQKDQGLFMDVNANSVEICSGVICLNEVRIVREKYQGFIGNLLFYDTQGLSDPVYTGLDGRYQLLYLEASEDAQLL